MLQETEYRGVLPPSYLPSHVFVDGGEDKLQRQQYPFDTGFRAIRLYYDLPTFLSVVLGRVKLGYQSYTCGTCSISQIESLAWIVHTGLCLPPPPHSQSEDLRKLEQHKKGKVGRFGVLDDGTKTAAARLLSYIPGAELAKVKDGHAPNIHWVLLALDECVEALPVEAWKSVRHNPIEICSHQLRWNVVSPRRGSTFCWGLSALDLNERNKMIDRAARRGQLDVVEQALDFSDRVGFWKVKTEQQALASKAAKLLGMKGAEALPFKFGSPLDPWRSNFILSSNGLISMLDDSAQERALFKDLPFSWLSDGVPA